MSINVTVVGATGVSATIGNSDVVQVGVGGTLANTPLTALQVTAGANITITTSAGVYTFIGPSVPIQSVNGQTGAVSLTLASLTAAAASHTHAMANIADLAFPVNAVNGKTGTVVLTSVDVSAASASHSHVAANISNLTSVANVVSVNGQTGVAVLNSTNVSAASAVHSHVAANISNLTSVANVVSVNGITGTPVIVGGSGVTISTAGSSITIEAAGATSGGAGLSDAAPQALGVASAGISGLPARADHVHSLPSAADIGAAAASHTHAASQVTDLTSFANVVSVNGKTGVVSLVASDVTAAAAAHGHDYVTKLNGQTGAVSIVAGGNVTVSASAGSITIAAPSPGDAFPSQAGNATRVLTTDGTAASWGTRYAVVEPVVVAGSGVTITKNSGAGQVVIAMDVTLLGESPVTPGFHVQSSAIYLTAVQYGYQYVVERFDAPLQQYVLYGSVVSSSLPPAIVQMNVGYNAAWYYRWRVLSSNSVPSPWGYSDGAPGAASGGGTASGGGIAMSYLFA
jgi:fibronectin-binding autotransporter adhesin